MGYKNERKSQCFETSSKYVRKALHLASQNLRRGKNQNVTWKMRSIFQELVECHEGLIDLVEHSLAKRYPAGGSGALCSLFPSRPLLARCRKLKKTSRTATSSFQPRVAFGWSSITISISFIEENSLTAASISVTSTKKLRLTMSELTTVVSWSELLQSAREGDDSALNQIWKELRSYLLMVAHQRLDAGLKGKMDASDVVQQSLMEAHRDFSEFRGQSEGEIKAWVCKLVVHNLADAGRRFRQSQKGMLAKRLLGPRKVNWRPRRTILLRALFCDNVKPMTKWRELYPSYPA